MTRFALTVEFDGRPFMGWQRQKHGPSVQAALEAAVLKMTGETVSVQAAGRTDAGVHGMAMRAHVDIAKPLAAFRLMVEVLSDLDAYPARPQPEEGVTYAAKIDKAEARIDFERSAVKVERLVRAMNPAPGAWFEVAGERVKVLAADVLPFSFLGCEGLTVNDALTIGCGDGAIRPTLVQRAGRGVTSAEELLRGFAIRSGTQL